MTDEGKTSKNPHCGKWKCRAKKDNGQVCSSGLYSQRMKDFGVALLKASMKGEKLSLEWECGCWDRFQFGLGSSKILAINLHHSQATDTGLVLTPKEPAWLTVYRDPQQGEETSSPRKHQQMQEPGSVVHAAGTLSHSIPQPNFVRQVAISSCLRREALRP